MPSIGRPNATGRSSGILTGRQAKAHYPPKGEPWVWLTRELLSSAAWRSRSINCVRLLDFLMVEHMNHAGTENGNLAAPYDQLVAFGLTRSEIRAAIEEAELLGLLRYERGGRWAGTNQPSRYQLTFLPGRGPEPPTNEWKRITQGYVDAWRQERSRTKQARKARRRIRKAGSASRTTVVRKVELPAAPD